MLLKSPVAHSSTTAQPHLREVPSDWQISTVEAIAAKTRNAIVGGPFGSELVSKDYAENGVPVIRGQNMAQKYVSGPYVYVTREKAKSLEANNAKPGDLVFTQRGTLGQVSIVPDQPHDRYLVSQSQMKVTLDPEKADPLFLYYVFSSSGQQENIRTSTVQTGVPHINLGILRAFMVQLPPVKEQRSIAAALSDVDALIGALDKLIEKKRAIKLATVQQLLTGKTRLPGWRTVGLQTSEIGVIPNDWQVKTLGELFEISSSKRVFQSQWKDSGVPFYRARELAVLGEAGHVDNELFITQHLYEQFRNSYGVPRFGDMLVTGVGTLGKTYVVSDEQAFYFKDGNIIWFKCAGKVCADYLKLLYETPLLRRQVFEGAAGTTVGTYTIQNAKKTVIPLPLGDEQNAISAIFRDIDTEIAALERRRDKTKLIKQGMMQVLLTGKVRLV